MKTNTATALASLVGVQIKNQQITAAEFRLLRSVVKAQGAIARIPLSHLTTFTPNDFGFILSCISSLDLLFDGDQLSGDLALERVSDVLENANQSASPDVFEAIDVVLEPVAKSARRLSKLTSNLRNR